jgi:hypothetical protein
MVNIGEVMGAATAVVNAIPDLKGHSVRVKIRENDYEAIIGKVNRAGNMKSFSIIIPKEVDHE